MAIAIRGTTPATNAVSGPNPITVSLTGTQQPQAGDVLIIIHGNDYYDITNLVTPTVGGSTTGVTAITGATVDAGSLTSHAKCWYYVVGSTGDLTVSETESGAGDEEKLLVVYVLSGADTSTVIDAAGGTFSATTTTSPLAPSVSPTSPDAFLICHTHPIGSPADPYTPPSGMTESYDTTDGGHNISLAGATVQLSASGATGTKTFGSFGSRGYVGLSIAVLTAGPMATADPGPFRPRPPGNQSPFGILTPVTPGAADVSPQPDRISGLSGWWKADSLSLNDSDPVASWSDSSGAGQTMSQGTSGNRPLYKTGIINGLPAVRFDGTDDFLSGTITSDAQATNWFVVMKAADGTNYLQIVYSGQEILRRDTDQRIETWAGASASNVSMIHDGSTWDYFSVEFNGASTMGYRIGSTSYPPWGDAGSGATGTAMRIGSHPTNGRPYHGDIAEIIQYNRALTQPEREYVFSYLQAKYFPAGAGNVNAAADVATGTGAALDVAVSVTVNADVASGSGSALDAVAAAGGNANVATGTGAALDASVAINVNADVASGSGLAGDSVGADAGNADVATGSGSALDASVAITAAADVAAGSGTAPDPTPAVAVNAEAATGTGTAPDPTVSTVNATNAPAEVATGTGAAPDPAPAVGANADVASGSGAALDAAATITASGDVATGSGSSLDAVSAVAVNANVATGTGAALDATVSTASIANAPAEVATGTGVAPDPTVAVTVNADVASGSGAAFNPNGGPSGNADVATGTGAALDAAVAVQVFAEAATGSGVAGAPSPGPSGLADVATGTGAAFDAAVAVTVNAGVATGSGAAPDPTAIGSSPGQALAQVATGTGTAYDARTRKLIPRPNTGQTTRPNTGRTARPYSGITQRP